MREYVIFVYKNVYARAFAGSALAVKSERNPVPVRDRPAEVLPTSEARRTLSQTVRRFLERGAEAEPVFFGSHRKPAGVILSFERYMKLLDQIDDLAIAQRIRERDANDTGERIPLDQFLANQGINRTDVERRVGDP
jgi:PHD/YefM family antitoxin component YafN of YafNO toxin-antitoxin module